MVASGSIKLRVIRIGIIYWVLCFPTGNQPRLVSTHFHLEGKRYLNKVQGDLCLAMARDIISFISPSVKSVNKLRFLNHSGKSVVMSCAPIRQASWATLITQTLQFSLVNAFIRGGKYTEPGGYEDSRRETQVSRRCEVCSNCSLSASVGDYGEGGINTKTGNWRPLRFSIWWSPLVPNQLLGLSHGLVEQLPKWAAKPQFWYTGPDARTESESSRLTKNLSRYFSTSAHCPQSPGLTRETSSWPIQRIDFLMLLWGANQYSPCRLTELGQTSLERFPFRHWFGPQSILVLQWLLAAQGGVQGWNLTRHAPPLRSTSPPHPVPRGSDEESVQAGSRTGLSKYQCYRGGKCFLAEFIPWSCKIIWPVKQSWVQYSHPASGQGQQ